MTTYAKKSQGYLTPSKLKAYLKDPWYFYRLYITQELEIAPTPSMKIGSAVDCWLTDGPDVFAQKYQVKVLKTESPELYKQQKTANPEFLLTPAENEKVMAIVDAIINTKAWDEIDTDQGYEFQKTLRLDKTNSTIGPYFKGVSGKPDLFKVDNTKARIVDIKTTSKIDEHKFKWECIDYQYYMQLAFYEMLIAGLYPEVEEFESYILAVETDNYMNRVQLFRLDPTTLALEKEKIKGLIDEISRLKEYKPKDVSFSDAILI